MVNKAIPNIWYSSLSDKVYIWKSKKEENHMVWVWDKKDYTNEFLHTVEQYFELWTSRVIKKWSEESLFLHIKNTKKAKEGLIKLLQKEIADDIIKD